MQTPPRITQVLHLANAGNREAANQLWERLYAELRRMAHRELYGERPGHTLSTTALVHEVYLRLVEHEPVVARDRGHFLSLACRAMREILVDYARKRKAGKRGGGAANLPLEHILEQAESRGEDVLALDEALVHLAEVDPRLVQVIECRYFGGLTTDETAVALGISSRTVERELKRSRTYLYQALRMEGGSP